MLHDACVNALSAVAVAATRFFVCMHGAEQAASHGSEPALPDIAGTGCVMCDGWYWMVAHMLM